MSHTFLSAQKKKSWKVFATLNEGIYDDSLGIIFNYFVQNNLLKAIK